MVGDHEMKLFVTLRDHPYFDYFIYREYKFKLTITSACDTETLTFGAIPSKY
jgi:hypothetical protein